MNKLVKSVTIDQLYLEYTRAIKSMVKITEREAQLLAELMKLDVPSKNRKSNVACTENRRIMVKNTGIYKDNVSRMVSKFRRTGILVQGPAEDELHVWNALMPEIIRDRVQLTVVLRIKNNDDERTKNSTSERGMYNSKESIQKDTTLVRKEEVDKGIAI